MARTSSAAKIIFDENLQDIDIKEFTDLAVAHLDGYAPVSRSA